MHAPSSPPAAQQHAFVHHIPIHHFGDPPLTIQVPAPPTILTTALSILHLGRLLIHLRRRERRKKMRLLKISSKNALRNFSLAGKVTEFTG